ncbi:MAG: hypothetical protein P1Q69_18530 [Candidatus Thorarchaeota archaeon]|nr:hypothetical protein [Candidatus Thorarchaeota archaeon]
MKLIGMPSDEIERVISDIISKDVKVSGQFTEDTLMARVSEILRSLKEEYSKKFETLLEYDYVRRIDSSMEPIVIVLEGASGTGKSMLALDMIRNISATRIISTDTVRQVLRSTLSSEDHPELFCHTYQAHEKRQSGSKDLDPVVRGYLAQIELLSPVIEEMTKRVLTEGAETIIEGVHVLPGSLSRLSKSVVEILINPNPDTHERMFASKHGTGLKSVSSDLKKRKEEYKATRIIQEYMLSQSLQNGVRVIPLGSYEEAEKAICDTVMETVRRILDSTA